MLSPDACRFAMPGKDSAAARHSKSNRVFTLSRWCIGNDKKIAISVNETSADDNKKVEFKTVKDYQFFQKCPSASSEHWIKMTVLEDDRKYWLRLPLGMPPFPDNLKAAPWCQLWLEQANKAAGEKGLGFESMKRVFRGNRSTQ